MVRLFVLVALVLVGVWLVRRALRHLDAGDAPPAPRPAEELVHCVHCGLLLPRAEAREASGGVYCTEEHARLGPRRR
jgi:uncharacterized protein